MSEDEKLDLHLREALRHAPDTSVQPPAALSALILSEAQAKARTAATPARKPLATAWAWLARPSVAASFAGVMAATLIGLMWWEQPMNVDMPRPPLAAPADAPAPPVAPAAPQAVPVPDAALHPTPPATPSAARKPAPIAHEAPSVQAKKEADAVAPVTAPAMAPASDEPSRAALPESETTKRQRFSADASNMAPGAERVQRSAGAMQGGQASDKTEPLEKRRAAPASLAAASPAAASLADLRATLAAEPARWRWQRGDATVHAMDAAVPAWLSQLDQATGSRWQTGADASTEPVARELRLLRDGVVVHRLSLGAHSVRWASEKGTRHAELPDAQIAALQAALDSAAP